MKIFSFICSLVCIAILYVTLTGETDTAIEQQEALQECNCEATFEELIVKLESNYVGLAIARISRQDSVYEYSKKVFRSKVGEYTSENCTSILNDFLSQFQDGHLSVIERPAYMEEEKAIFEEYIKSQQKTMAEINTLWQADMHGDIVGEWTNGTSKFLIVNNGGLFEAYITETENGTAKIGELKATFESNSSNYDIKYYSSDYSLYSLKGNAFKKNTLLKFSPITWVRTKSEFTRELSLINKSDFKAPVAQKIDNQTTLLSIPSFSIDLKVFKKFLSSNKRILRNTTHLIIDIRGNTGGNAIYFDLIKLYADTSGSASQGLVLASEDNKNYFRRLKGRWPSSIYSPLLSRIESNMGDIVDGPKYPARRYRKAKNKIEHISILTDKGAMSAAESFILHSKEMSNRVTTYGAPTQGVIDYTSVNAIKLINSGRQNIIFGYPTGTLHKNIPEQGYNKTGMIPDVLINSTVKDLIKFIADYYKND